MHQLQWVCTEFDYVELVNEPDFPWHRLGEASQCLSGISAYLSNDHYLCQSGGSQILEEKCFVYLQHPPRPRSISFPHNYDTGTIINYDPRNYLFDSLDDPLPHSP